MLLEACRERPVKKFVYASSSSVYGDTKDLPMMESSLPCPVSPYGVSKFAVEKYLQAYNNIYGLDYVSLRYGNVYGPRQDPYGEAGVVAIFAQKMLNGEEPNVNGDGEQTRDFVYIDDVAKANLLAIENKIKNQNMNISTSIETSVNEIFETIQFNLGTSTRPRNAPPYKRRG